VDKRAVERDIYNVLLQRVPIAEVTRPTEVENLFIVPATLTWPARRSSSSRRCSAKTV